MTPKWGFEVAILPVGALYFSHAHVGRTVLHGHFGGICSILYFAVFQSLGGSGMRLFAYSWKLPAYSGAFLLTVDNFSFFT